MINCEKLLLKIFKDNKEFIFNNWLSLVGENVKIQDEFEFNTLIELFKRILDNYINYLNDENIELYVESTRKIAKEIANHNISYINFMNFIQYFQESYINILTQKVKCSSINKYLIISNRIYNKTLNIIRDEYFSIKDSTLTAIVELSELRDDVTGNHNERTKEYATMLSRLLNLDDIFIRNINKASLLHDIGKVAIKDEILLKPGRLTEDEFKEMKNHTIIGAKTISKVVNAKNIMDEYLYMAIDIALCHHEKYDGSGYPNGLAGTQIPLSARIFALVDAYDVITSQRPYKQSLSHKEAVRRIILDSGKHFDPDIVSVFVKNQSKLKLINDKYKT